MTDIPGESGLSYASSSGPQPAPELVAFTDCEIVPINTGMTLVINRQNGKQQILSPQVVEGMKTCTAFRTIEEHAAHLAKTRAELNGQESMAISALHSLDESGMLLHASDICERLAHSVPRELPPTRVFINTCDRPEAVERLLDSLLRTGKLSQHDAIFLVDDSRHSANRDANRELVARFNLSSAREMCYVGAEVQQSLMAGLIRKLPQHEQGIRFLLDPACWEGSATYGRTRTLCLLLSVGYRALVMDDDVLCQAIEPPVPADDDRVLFGTAPLREACFYSSEQEMFQSVRPADFDPLSAHARFLGSTLGSTLSEINGGPLRPDEFQECNASFINVLTPRSPILVTQNGSLGDPGVGSPHWLLSQSESTLERVVAGSQDLTSAAETRLNWFGSSRPTIYKFPVMSQLTGLDNSQLLPPYFPAFRGEDVLFGAMLVAIRPDCMGLEYPWCVPHLPIDARKHSVDAPMTGWDAVALFSYYLTEQIDYRDTADPALNLSSLAQAIRRMAAYSDEVLLLEFRKQLAKSHIGSLRNLRRQLTVAEKLNSAELQAYVARGIDQLQQALLVETSPVDNAGTRAELTEAEAFARLRAMMVGFAQGLTGWVDMRGVAATLTGELLSSGVMRPD